MSEKEKGNEGKKNKREIRNVKYRPDLMIKSKKKSISLLLLGAYMPSKPFNLPNFPKETEAHIVYVNCSKITLPQSGRTRT